LISKGILMKKLCIGLLCLLVLPVAIAGNRPGALTLTGGAGYEYFSSKRDIENTGVGYVELGYDMTQHWGFEGFLGGFKTNSNNANDTRDVDGTLFAVDVLYHFSPVYCMVEPFLLAGPGITSIDPNGSDAHTEGNINAGAGLQFFIHKSIALKIEARDFYQITSTKNDVLVDGGISFLFDVR
jgi:hypothetical protein